MLFFQVLFKNKNPQAFLALYYNPFYPNEYKHTFTKRIMDMNSEVLIGEQMWDKLGGEGTYEELLRLLKR